MALKEECGAPWREQMGAPREGSHLQRTHLQLPHIPHLCANPKIKSFTQSPLESAPLGNVELMWLNLGRPNLDYGQVEGRVYPNGRLTDQ